MEKFVVLDELCVSPDCQGNGTGSRFMKKIAVITDREAGKELKHRDKQK